MGGFESVFRPDLFEGRTVLVTGGGTGLGRCNAHELASLGAQVVIAGRREDVLEQTAEEIRSCLLYTSPSPRDGLLSRMPSSA